jgi:hypothetical protein
MDDSKHCYDMAQMARMTMWWSKQKRARDGKKARPLVMQDGEQATHLCMQPRRERTEATEMLGTRRLF